MGAYYYVGEHPHAFFQLHEGEDVRALVEAGGTGLVDYGVGTDGAFAAGLHPLRLLRPAVGADAPGVELVLVALVAVLIEQLAAEAGTLVGAGLADDGRQQLVPSGMIGTPLTVRATGFRLHRSPQPSPSREREFLLP